MIEEKELIQRIVLDYGLANLPYLWMLISIPARLRHCPMPRDEAMVQSRRIQQALTLLLLGDYVLYSILPILCPVSWGFLASLYWQQLPCLEFLQVIHLLPVSALSLQFYHGLHLEADPRQLWHLRELPWCLETFLCCLQLLGLLISHIPLQVGQLLFYLVKLFSFSGLLFFTCLDPQRGTNFIMSKPLLVQSSPEEKRPLLDENRFVSFFKVLPLGHEQSHSRAYYLFEVVPVQGRPLRIKERFSRFKRLHSRMKAAGLNPPGLPSQLTTSLELRQEGLASFLRRVLNHPAYFHQEVFSLVGFSQAVPEKVVSEYPWQALQVSVLPLAKVYDQVSHQVDSLVTIDVTPAPPLQPYSLQRKTSEFRHLHKECVQLGVYPGSFQSQFMKRSYSSGLQQVLQEYLEGLLEVQWEKADCLEVRVFLQLEEPPKE